MTQEQYTEIIGHLNDTGAFHLAESFDLIPIANREAIAYMVQQMKKAKRPETDIQFSIYTDVVGLLSGDPSFKPRSSKYLPETA